MDKNRKCPICGGEFEEGWLRARADLYFSKNEKLPLFSDNTLKRVKCLHCLNCGYLESYAK